MVRWKRERVRMRALPETIAIVTRMRYGEYLGHWDKGDVVLDFGRATKRRNASALRPVSAEGGVCSILRYMPLTTMSDQHSPLKSKFQKDRHITYWLRCLKTYLPTGYTSNDSQRMTLAFFTLSALDLLGELHTNTTESDRQAYVDWVYRCQHPDGGFKGFTGADGGPRMWDGPGRCWDPANLAATFFALVVLMILGDEMKRIHRQNCLKWIRTLQRPDGSFGEVIGKDGRVEGVADTRNCYLAAGVRLILRRGEEMEDVDDINVNGLVDYIERSVVSMIV